VRYCGVVPAGGGLQIAVLQELRAEDPPVRLTAAFYEPGSADQVAAEVGGFGDAVIAVGAPLTDASGAAGRACDRLLAERGVAPRAADPAARRLGDALAARGLFLPDADGEQGPVAEGAFREAPLFETNPDAIFCALQARRLPARRHPLGVRMRIDELLAGHVIDDGGELWHRRIEEVDAAAAALCAHRYAVGHACWLGDPAEAVIVLPGSAVPGRFATHGVLPPVERLELPRR
jgi:predicted nuclease with RNAse H fold